MNLDPRAVESLLGFWAEAGVDVCYAEAPIDRTLPAIRSATPRPSPGAAPSAQAPIAISTAVDPPMDLDEARRAATAAGDLAALEAAITAYDGCALKRAGAKRCVFSRGHPDGPVMVIGEAPGADEDAQGAPFVGRAGKLLDLMLRAAGLEGRVFITNTVFWRPPGNRTPTPAEQMVCAPFLERAIALVRPRALLLVGGASTKAMLNQSEGILTLRGRWFEWRSPDGDLEIPALPTLHPAFLLRQPAAKKKAWQDLLTLVERVDRPDRPVSPAD